MYPATNSPNDAPITADVARGLGADAFVFGFPLLLMTAAMRHATNVLVPIGGRAPLNQFAHLNDFPSPAYKGIVGANSDTLYSLAWLDLSAEPLLLDLPDTGRRSFLMPLIDAWTEVFICVGPRTTGTAGGTYGLVGPGWSGSLPEGIQRIDMPTNLVSVIVHFHAREGGDLEAGRAIQQGLSLTPFSAHGRGYSPPEGLVDPSLEALPNHLRLVMKMKADEFLANLAAEMDVNPPSSSDRPLLDRLETIGLSPGRPFEWSKLPEEVQEALEAGVADSREVLASPTTPLRLDNGWQGLREKFGPYSIDYLRRAQIAALALGVPNPEDASFPITSIDSKGDALHGGSRYVVEFGQDGIPPVGALWSLVLYDMDQMFVHNSIDRYALGDRDELELDSNGSLEITIQKDRPDGSDANWLPAPEGDFNLMLHMYWPGRRVLDGSWAIPAVRRV